MLGLNCQNKPNGFSSCCVLRGGAEIIRFILILIDWGTAQTSVMDYNNLLLDNNNLLLTEREGRTGEYWSEVVTVRTERSEVRTKTTEGQYSPVRPEQARLVSSLLYGTLFLIVKCTSGGLHLKNVRLLHPSLKFRKKFNLFSFCPLVVKNDNFHTFFFAVLVANVEFAGFAPKQKYTDWTVSMETVRTAKS